MAWGGRSRVMMPRAVVGAIVFVLLLAFVAQQAHGDRATAAMAHEAQYHRLYNSHDAAALDLFNRWIEKHSRVYHSPIEKKYRFEIFKDNLRYIHTHNTRPNQTFWMWLNEFSDLTHDEFRSRSMGMLPAEGGVFGVRNEANFMFEDVAVEPSVDWRTKGAVSEVKNQGHCGSCWAFSAIGAIEAINQMVTGQMVTLSEQELVDCDRGSINKGCRGGNMGYAFDFIVNNGGIDTESDYPYTGDNSAHCNVGKLQNSKVVAIEGHQLVPRYSEKALLQAVTKQPVSVAIDSSGRDFQHYQGGVFTGPCGISLDHAVLAVGYGTDAATGQDYWLLKNQWGTHWGEGGYMRMVRAGAGDPYGKCGINMEAYFPTKVAPTPPPPPPPKPASKAVAKQCDQAGQFSCPASSTCCCVDPSCRQWACCPLQSATCCGRNFCCPADHPVCDLNGGRCLKSNNNPFGVPRMQRTPAQFIAAENSVFHS